MGRPNRLRACLSGTGAAEADSPRAILEQKQQKLSRRRFIIGLLFKMAATGAALYLLLGVLLGIGRVRGDSMRPALYAGDVVVFLRPMRPGRGDVVMIRQPSGGSDYIKRVAGLPGDTVSLDAGSGELWVNGQACGSEGPDILGPTVRAGAEYQTSGGVQYPLRLGEDDYFVLGDNRQDSRDSRHYGAVPRSEIDGRVIMIIRVG